MSTPAGWYANPENVNELRYWDGAAWTEHTAPATQTPDPAAPASQPATTEAAWGAAAAPAAGGFGQPMGARPGYASWGTRLAAYFIDGLVVLPIFIVYTILSFATRNSAVLSIILVLLYFAGIIAALVVFVYMGEGRTGQTYGKHMMGISALNKNTLRPIGSGMSFVRGIVKSLAAIPCYLGLLWPLWDAEKRGWHDMAMSTHVLETGPAQKISNPIEFAKYVLAAPKP